MRATFAWCGPGVDDDHLHRGAGAVGGLVDRDLVLQVPLELRVAGELELDERLVSGSKADLEVDGAAAVVDLPVDVELGAAPDQAEDELDLLLVREGLARPG